MWNWKMNVNIASVKKHRANIFFVQFTLDTLVIGWEEKNDYNKESSR